MARASWWPLAGRSRRKQTVDPRQRGYEVYDALFKPKGYKMRAQILNYPNSMLGDVGVFLLW